MYLAFHKKIKIYLVWWCIRALSWECFYTVIATIYQVTCTINTYISKKDGEKSVQKMVLFQKSFLTIKVQQQQQWQHARERDEEKLFHYNTNVTGLPFFLSLFPYLLLPFRTVYCFSCRIILFRLSVSSRTRQTHKQENNECNHLLYISPLCIYLFGFVDDCFNKMHTTAHHIPVVCSVCSCRMIQ